MTMALFLLVVVALVFTVIGAGLMAYFLIRAIIRHL